jgi:hypothetical protein
MAQIECEKDVVDVLGEGGVEPGDIDAIIFRYVCSSVRVFTISPS